MHIIAQIISGYGLSLAQAIIMYALYHEGGSAPLIKRHLKTITGISNTQTLNSALAALEGMDLVFKIEPSESETGRIRIGISPEIVQNRTISDVPINTRARAFKETLRVSKETPKGAEWQIGKDADCQAAKVIVLMDDAMMVRVVSAAQADDDELVLCDRYRVRRKKALPALVTAWNDWLNRQKNSTPDEATRKELVRFAKWLMLKSMEDSPTADWISKRWKHRLRLIADRGRAA